MELTDAGRRLRAALAALTVQGVSSTFQSEDASVTEYLRRAA